MLFVNNGHMCQSVSVSHLGSQTVFSLSSSARQHRGESRVLADPVEVGEGDGRAGEDLPAAGVPLGREHRAEVPAGDRDRETEHQRQDRIEVVRDRPQEREVRVVIRTSRPEPEISV